MEICSFDLCTGCGACTYACPKQCIKMEENAEGIVFPRVDEAECISCNRCKSVCPSLNDIGFNKPMLSYAAWSTSESERSSSASGGVGIELCYYAIENGWAVGGARMGEDFKVNLHLAESKEEAYAFKNSKYVFSEPYSLYPKLKETLASGKKVIVIALPCQIAAIKSLFDGYENLYLVDVVCHGSTPFSYLKQHVEMLERSAGKMAAKMSFRDASYKTSSFTFTLYDSDNNCFYAKRTKDKDSYQFGYHKAVSYRENCYSCRYAQTKRVSDITLCDYWGLGEKAPWEYEKENVTCVLINTEKGKAIVNALISENRIRAHERPLNEQIEANSQLRCPVKKSKLRYDFEAEIKRYQGDFEAAMAVVMKRNDRREKVNKAKNFFKRVIKRIIKGR